MEPTPRTEVVRAARGDPGDAWIGAPRPRSVASFAVRAVVLVGLALGAPATAADAAGTASAAGAGGPAGPVSVTAKAGTGCCPDP